MNRVGGCPLTLLFFFYLKMTNENKQPPEELVKQCEELNKQWLTNKAIAVPAFHEGDFSSGWRIKIHDHKKQTLIDYIQPELAHGHTLYLTVCCIEEAYQRGLCAGKQNAITNICDAISKVVNSQSSFD